MCTVTNQGQKPTHCLMWRRPTCCWSLLSSPALRGDFRLCCQTPTEHLQMGLLKTAQLLLDQHIGGSGCAANGRRGKYWIALKSKFIFTPFMHFQLNAVHVGYNSRTTYILKPIYITSCFFQLLLVQMLSLYTFQLVYFLSFYFDFPSHSYSSTFIWSFTY